ncbi:fibrillin-2 [Puntigrus tetrazona]|uniref:fibrillin-2 n=1 Tax=Puntigrus tetrazona TaxID=1606681 RepID=UPI001C89111B|nr:fibrillin-2 [Puntigrus tetrazona]
MDSHKRTIFFTVIISSCAGMVYSCACTKNVKHCANVYQMPVDFQTAERVCGERGGRLLIQANASDELVDYLLNNLIGHFWTGLSVSSEMCLNNTGSRSSDFTNLETEGKSCVPLCASVSADGMRTPRPCAEKLNGFLCEETRGELCKGSAVVLDSARCMFAPCEHKCAPVKNGYRCSCKESFRSNARDPRRCDFYCSERVCQALCLRGGSACWCPAGFVRSEQTCEDIDECESNHGCAHKCENTIGSYGCACYEPFILVNETECTLSSSLYNAKLLPTPSSNYIARGALSTPAEYAGLIVFLVVALFALLVLVYYLRGRKVTVQERNPPDHEEFQESASK